MATTIYSHSAATGTGVGAWIDTLDLNNPLAPPALHLVNTGAGSVTFTIEGSHDATAATTVTYLTATTLTTGTNDARDLVSGVRYWRTNVSANAGNFTSSVGPSFRDGAGVILPHNQTVTTFPNSS